MCISFILYLAKSVTAFEEYGYKLCKTFVNQILKNYELED